MSDFLYFRAFQFIKDVGVFFWGFLTPKTGSELKNIIIFEIDMTENFVCNTCKIAV